MKTTSLSVLPPQIGLDDAGEALRKELNVTIVSLLTAHGLPPASVDNLSAEELAAAKDPVSGTGVTGHLGHAVRNSHLFRDVLWREEAALRHRLHDEWFPALRAARVVENGTKYSDWLAAKAAADADPSNANKAALAAAQTAMDDVLAQINAGDPSAVRLNLAEIEQLTTKARAYEDLANRRARPISTNAALAREVDERF